jgi:hypothetical protein
MTVRDRVRLWADLVGTDLESAAKLCDVIVYSQPVRQSLLDRLNRVTQKEFHLCTKAERPYVRHKFDFG